MNVTNEEKHLKKNKQTNKQTNKQKAKKQKVTYLTEKHLFCA
jgi:hypothetical protein